MSGKVDEALVSFSVLLDQCTDSTAVRLGDVLAVLVTHHARHSHWKQVRQSYRRTSNTSPRLLLEQVNFCKQRSLFNIHYEARLIIFRCVKLAQAYVQRVHLLHVCLKKNRACWSI